MYRSSNNTFDIWVYYLLHCTDTFMYTLTLIPAAAPVSNESLAHNACVESICNGTARGSISAHVHPTMDPMAFRND